MRLSQRRSQLPTQKGKRIIESARAVIENEKQAALTEVKNMVATLSIDIAEKVLRKEFEQKSAQEAFVKAAH